MEPVSTGIISSMLPGSIVALGGALVAFAAAFGISTIGKAAMEAISRQPEAAKNIQTSMLIAAALIEGVALFCCIICILAIVMK